MKNLANPLSGPLRTLKSKAISGSFCLKIPRD